jgi:hypothetical protein
MSAQTDSRETLAERYNVSIHPENAEMFSEWVDDDTNVVDRLWRYVCPDMSERQRARTAVLLTLASEADRAGFRGRQHTLLYDDDVGGTGKTALGEWVKYQLPDSFGIGPDAREAGLKFNGNTGQPGKLHMAHEGTLRIEEFGKFDRDDREATFEAMSEGYFEVDKGGVNTEFPASIRVIALANNMDRLSDAIQTRFDYAIEMDEYDADETLTVSESRYETFRDRFVRGEDVSSDPLLPQYFNFVGGYRPAYPDETHERIIEMLETLVREHGQNGQIREKEGYIRGAYTIAKLNLREVRPEDWARTVDLVHPEIDARDVFDLP